MYVPSNQTKIYVLENTGALNARVDTLDESMSKNASHRYPPMDIIRLH